MNHTGSPPVAKTAEPEITLTLIDNGSDRRPVAIRRRQLLKLALRAFGLRCTDATGLDREEIQ